MAKTTVEVAGDDSGVQPYLGSGGGGCCRIRLLGRFILVTAAE